MAFLNNTFSQVTRDIRSLIVCLFEIKRVKWNKLKGIPSKSSVKMEKLPKPNVSKNQWSFHRSTSIVCSFSQRYIYKSQLTELERLQLFSESVWKINIELLRLILFKIIFFCLRVNPEFLQEKYFDRDL